MNPMFLRETKADMQKHPSRLAVLVETFLALAETFKQDLVVLQDYRWKAEEIKNELTNTS
jgi:hypothetical protein